MIKVIKRCLRFTLLLICLLTITAPAQAADHKNKAGKSKNKPKKPAASTAAKPALEKKEVAANPASSASAKTAGMDFNKQPTTVTAKKLNFNPDNRVFVYSGEVTVVNGDMTLTCERLEGAYSETNEITKLVAINKVHIVKADGLEANSNRATYDGRTQTIHLTENPQVLQNGSILAADLIKIYTVENRTEAEGNVQVRLVQQSGAGGGSLLGKPKDATTTSPTAN